MSVSENRAPGAAPPRRRRRLQDALLLVLAAMAPVACGEVEAANDLSHFQALVGDWQGTHRVLGNPEEYEAGYRIYFDGDAFLVHEFKSNWNGGFSGRERMIVDGDHLRAVWKDSMSDEPSVTTGHYDPATRTLTMTGTGESFEHPGETVEYEHVTVYRDDSFSYTMTTLADGERTDVMWIDMERVEE